jgi:hypothetical protein
MAALAGRYPCGRGEPAPAACRRDSPTRCTGTHDGGEQPQKRERCGTLLQCRPSPPATRVHARPDALPEGSRTQVSNLLSLLGRHAVSGWRRKHVTGGRSDLGPEAPTRDRLREAGPSAAASCTQTGQPSRRLSRRSEATPLSSGTEPNGRSRPPSTRTRETTDRSPNRCCARDGCCSCPLACLVCERFTSYQFWRAFRLPIDFGHFDVSFVRNIRPELIGSWSGQASREWPVEGTLGWPHR